MFLCVFQWEEDQAWHLPGAVRPPCVYFYRESDVCFCVYFYREFDVCLCVYFSEKKIKHDTYLVPYAHLVCISIGSLMYVSVCISVRRRSSIDTYLVPYTHLVCISIGSLMYVSVCISIGSLMYVSVCISVRRRSSMTLTWCRTPTLCVFL